MQSVVTHTLIQKSKPSPWSQDGLQKLRVRITYCSTIILLEVMRPSVLYQVYE